MYACGIIDSCLHHPANNHEPRAQQQQWCSSRRHLVSANKNPDRENSSAKRDAPDRGPQGQENPSGGRVLIQLVGYEKVCGGVV